MSYRQFYQESNSRHEFLSGVEDGHVSRGIPGPRVTKEQGKRQASAVSHLLDALRRNRSSCVPESSHSTGQK
jgi:hypothetical protein